MTKYLWSIVNRQGCFLLFSLIFLGILGASLIFPQESSPEEEKKFDLQVYLTKKEALEIAFPGADTIDKERKWLTDEQKTAIAKISLLEIREIRFTFYVGKKNGKPTGYMLIDHIIGKSFPITFMTVLNVDGTVRDVEILVYREPRGWEVRFPSFMSQFFGMNAQSDFRDINSITGATLSVRAITKGVKKAVFSSNREEILTISDTLLYLWSKTGKEIRRFIGHNKGVWDCKFSPDESKVYSCAWDKTAIIWNINGGSNIKLIGHEGLVTTIFSLVSTKHYITSSKDATVKIWDE
ncbi:MAG: FMN-binding protein, partial [Nitrospinae bacterium]|nr:FMN-binding protein [Nitrospinota bacterium]